MTSCPFCRIAAGTLEAHIVYRDDVCLVFRDIHPQAPVHLLIIPIRHIENLQAIGEEEKTLMGHLLLIASQVARRMHLDDYRIVINNGSGAGQSVFHLHLHLLSGRRMGWPPG